MDLNHDFDGTNEFLLTGAAMRLQMVKNVILSFGDMGYTDPRLSDIRYAIGEYTDESQQAQLENTINTILVESQVVTPEEIVSIEITSLPGASSFTANLSFTFGSITGLQGAIPGT